MQAYNVSKFVQRKTFWTILKLNLIHFSEVIAVYFLSLSALFTLISNGQSAIDMDQLTLFLEQVVQVS